MAEQTALEMTQAAFLESFPKLLPVILAEWQQIDSASLTATDGDLDKVIAVLADKTAHTKALLRKQLEELWQIVCEPPKRASGERPQPANPSRLRKNLHEMLPETADELLREFEQRTARVLKQLRGGLLKDTSNRVRENLLFSLLVTLGLGFIVGVLFTGWNFRRAR